MAFRLLGFFFVILATTSALKVPVTIFYEALCPDSAKFITEQVHPAVSAPNGSGLKDNVEITWVPFGKSKAHTQGSDVIFECHHGPNECIANKVHACAIEHIQANSYQHEFTRESLTLDFIACMMKASTFPDNALQGERCARENHIENWESIHQCYNNTEGSQLLKRHGDTTKAFQDPLEHVPTVLFTQNFDAKDNENAMSNFLKTVCRHVPQPIPKACMAFNGAVSFSQISLFGVLAIFAFTRLF